MLLVTNENKLKTRLAHISKVCNKKRSTYNRIFFNGNYVFAVEGHIICGMDLSDCIYNTEKFSIPVNTIPKRSVEVVDENSLLVDGKKVYFLQISNMVLDYEKFMQVGDYNGIIYYTLPTIPKIVGSGANAIITIMDNKVIVDYKDDDGVIGEFGDVHLFGRDIESRGTDFCCLLKYFNYIKNKREFSLMQNKKTGNAWIVSGGYDYIISTIETKYRVEE